jgi:uncharacterized membrane protein YhaH (DUF805 family)
MDMKRRDLTSPSEPLKPVVRLLFDYRGEIGRFEFFLAELVRGAGLVVCYILYQQGWFVIAATLAPVAIWPGVVATIKRFRNLGHDPVLILPVLMYLSAGFAVGYRYDNPAIGMITLGIYLVYVSGVEGRAETFTADEYTFDN